ncbi:MAG TPA: ATP-binding cassette domain-containing protein, partial [Candidatus Binatia bacterium]|nr:ATP-binding cassette domain-containing protein [Candidatus Binatia bacterium]
MSHASVIFHNVSFTYDAASIPLLADCTAHFPEGWTGIVGANGAGKTTLLRLATGELTPQQGSVRAPVDAIYCPQRTDTAPPSFAELLAVTDGDAQEIKGRLGIEDEWLYRWRTLSHGERKRAQIGVALWRRPQVLAIDEPTNHLDAEARQLLISALGTFSGVGLLVSHDRELLDSLCCQCLFMEPPRAIMRPGGLTQGAEQARRDAAQIRRQAELARRERVHLEREAALRREEAARAHHKRSKRGLDRKDHDARFTKNLARLTGKDGAAGKLLRQLQGRLEQARCKEEQITVTKTYNLGIWLPGSCSPRNALFTIPAGSLPLGNERRLRFPELVMRPTDRVALTGPNGGGKSTLVRRIVSILDLPPEQVTYMPQEIDQDTARALLTQVRNLAKEKLGRLMTIVSCLGSRPQRLLETAEPSPGETRKILLALGITQAPHLIVMDEPTNHLDLPSIECLEDALAECPCGLLLVSHDQYFLNRLT